MGKLWIGVWIRDYEREGEKFVEDAKRVGEQPLFLSFKIFKFQIMRESFTRST